MIDKIKNSVNNNRIIWQEHSVVRMIERRIKRNEVLKAFENGEVIENYPKDKPYPSSLMLGWLENRPIHIVFGYDEKSDFVYIISVYEPNIKKFESDYKTRRKK